MWLIPKKTKVKSEIFRGIGMLDILLGAVGLLLIVFLMLTNYSLNTKMIIGGIIIVLFVFLLVRVDGEPNYIFMLHIINHVFFTKHYARFVDDDFLIKASQVGEFEAASDIVFAEEEKATLSPKEKKKAEKELIKEENKILKDKNSTKEMQDAVWLARAERSAEKAKSKRANKDDVSSWEDMTNLIGFTNIEDRYIVYGSEYYGAVIEIEPVEFRFFSTFRRNNSIKNGVGRIFSNISNEFAANIVKIERPLHYEKYEANEYNKINELKHSYELGMISEEELKARVEIIYDRIVEIQRYMTEDKVIVPHYYLVLYDSDKGMLENTVSSALDSLNLAEIPANRLYQRELAIFLKYANAIDFDEAEIDELPPEAYVKWAMPEQVDVRVRTVEVDHIVTRNQRVFQTPITVGDAWLAYVMSVPATKVVVKFKPMDRQRAIRDIDRSLNELRVQYGETNVESKLLELRNHISSLESLLETLHNDMESLLEVNIYVTSYDIVTTNNDPKIDGPEKSERVNMANMQKAIRRYYSEEGFRLKNHDFEQLKAFIGSQITGYDPFNKDAMGIPSNSLAAAYPWIYAKVSDERGIKLGASDGVPVFIDFFRRDNERINSNMVIIGKSGSGKSYATKSLLANLAADDSKIFILDPENEYAELAQNLHGQFINVGNAQQGRLNPFHIMTSSEDDEDAGESVSGSYATHLQFLEEFFRQILPDCDKDALEYLNSLIDRLYMDMGITAETELRKLRPEDYPIFDDLYDEILQEFQQTDNEYIRRMLRVLMNYIAKFSTGGRNANIWNGPSTITTEENFSVFNFQSLLSNRNNTIANAQMLLVLKYIDNEIIKNRDYNLKNNTNRKIIVAIDEAHVFIDEKFPVALDFMYQLAKRIRKYNGMQIVITQNIKDFVGTEELARKSTAIINACQYSFIFALAPNDMNDLCKLYEKAGEINDMEQEQILNAARGQAFTIMGPQSRTAFKVEVPDEIVDMFQNSDYHSSYFIGEDGELEWEDFVGDSRMLHEASNFNKLAEENELEQEYVQPQRKNAVIYNELTEEEAEELLAKRLEAIANFEINEYDASDEESSGDDEGGFQFTETDFVEDEPEEELYDEQAVEQPTEPQVQQIVQPTIDMQNMLDAQANMFTSMENMFSQFMEIMSKQAEIQNEATAAASASVSNAIEELARNIENVKVNANRENEEQERSISEGDISGSETESGDTSSSETKADDTSSSEETSYKSSLFESSIFDSEEEDDDDGFSLETDESDDDDGFSLFDSNGELDIMALLTREAERMKDITKIDQMEFDEIEITTISLADLQAYLMKK